MRVVGEVVTSPPVAATSGPGAILVTPELPPPDSLLGMTVIRLGNLIVSNDLNVNSVAFVIVAKGFQTSFYKRNDDKVRLAVTFPTVRRRASGSLMVSA